MTTNRPSRWRRPGRVQHQRRGHLLELIALLAGRAGGLLERSALGAQLALPLDALWHLAP